MDRADFPDKSGAKSIKHAIDRDDRVEEACYGVGVIGPRSPIITKRNGIGNFIWATVELRCTAELANQVQKASMKFGNGHLAEREARFASNRRSGNDCMVEKIKGDL